MGERYLKRIALAEITNAPYGVGSFTEGVTLLIGEQASDPENAPEQQPFCSDQGCSGWLNKLLEIEDVPEESLFWVNALNNDSSKINLNQLVKELKPKKIIALGNVASTLCSEQGIVAEKCSHPQYWKRFRSKERYPLLDLLDKIF